MAGPPNPRLQGRIELMIRVAAPVLDLMLLAGEGVSRVIHRAAKEPLATTGAPRREAAQGGPR
jgi:hypothetical protein